MMELNNVTAGYGRHHVLQNVDIVCNAGQLTVLVGPNGSGKSTLLRIAAGLQTPESGQVLLNGQNIAALGRKQRACSIAYLPQGRSIPEMSVARLVLQGRFAHMGYPRRYTKTDEAVALQAMAQVGIEHLAEKSLQRLSGGERQKAYIAMVVAQQADVLLLDEPTTYLDIHHQLEIMALMTELKKQGKTVLMVLHDLHLALAHADKLCVLQQGRVLNSGTVDEVYQSGALQQAFGVHVQREESSTAGTGYFITRL